MATNASGAPTGPLPAQTREYRGHEARMFWCDLLESDNVENESLVATACEDGTIGVWRDGEDRAQRTHIFFKAHDDESLRVLWDNGQPAAAGKRIMHSGGARGDVKTWVVDMDAQQEKVGLLHETHCVDSSRSEQNDGQVYGLLQFEQREELAVAHDDRITVLHKNGLQELLSWRYGSRGSVTAGGSRNPHNMAYVFDSTVHETCVFAGLSDGSVRGRDLRSPLYDTLCIDDAHDSHVTCCAVSGSGTYILSGSGRGGTALYDRRATENGPLWRKLPSDGETPRPIYGGTFWPQRDDLMMTWSSSGDLCFMDAKGRSRLFSPHFKTRTQRGQKYPIFSLSMSAQWSRLVLCGGTTPSEPPVGAPRNAGRKRSRSVSNSGLRRAPTLAEGALPVRADPLDHSVPWLSMRLEATSVTELIDSGAQ